MRDKVRHITIEEMEVPFVAPRNTNGFPFSRGKASSSASAAGDSGTRCSLFIFIRAAVDRPNLLLKIYLIPPCANRLAGAYRS